MLKKKPQPSNPKTLKKCTDIAKGEKNLFESLERRTKQSGGSLVHYVLSV